MTRSQRLWVKFDAELTRVRARDRACGLSWKGHLYSPDERRLATALCILNERMERIGTTHPRDLKS